MVSNQDRLAIPRRVTSQSESFRLCNQEIELIQNALARAGAFGRVRLVVNGGKLCHIEVTESRPVTQIPQR